MYKLLGQQYHFSCLKTEVLDEHGISPDIEESSPAQEEALTSCVSEAVGSSATGAAPSVFAIVSILLGKFYEFMGIPLQAVFTSRETDYGIIFPVAEQVK